MSLQHSCSVCHYNTVAVYVITTQLQCMSLQHSCSVCHYNTVAVYVITTQLQCMSLQHSCSVCHYNNFDFEFFSLNSLKYLLNGIECDEALGTSTQQRT